MDISESNKEFLQGKKTLLNDFYSITKDHSQSILDTNGIVLYDLDVSISLELVKILSTQIRRLSYAFETEFEKDALLNQIEDLLASNATTIVSLNANANSVIQKIKERFKNTNPQILTEEEVLLETSALLNPQTKASFLNFLQDEDEVFRIIAETLCLNATIDNFMNNNIQDGDTCDVEELMSIDPKIGYHVKKTALDQICGTIFKDYDSNYDSLKYLTTLDENSELNELSPFKIDKNQLAFVFVNAKKMDSVSFPKFIELMDLKTGKSCYVNEVVQDVKELIIPCKIANKNINVKTQITKGIILTTIVN